MKETRVIEYVPLSNDQQHFKLRLVPSFVSTATSIVRLHLVIQHGKVGARVKVALHRYGPT